MFISHLLFSTTFLLSNRSSLVELLKNKYYQLFIDEKYQDQLYSLYRRRFRCHFIDSTIIS